MPDFGTGFNIRSPLDSAPLTGEVLSVDLVDRSCVVQIQSDVVDDVTWYGPDLVEGELVYLTNAGDRIIAVSGAAITDHSHDDDYVNVTGDTMTGRLYLSLATAVATEAARKDYVDGKVINGLGTSSTSAPSQNVVTAALDTKIPKATTTITDWDQATSNGFYMSNGAANSPSSTKTGWWYGWVVVHNSSWMTQFAMPFAQNGIDGAVLSARHKENGVWGTWYRVVNYSALSWDTLDNFIYIRHGGNSASATSSATPRWAIGNKKDASASPSGGDEFRVQRYDTGGSYIDKPIYIGSDDGIVRMPNNGGTVPTLLGVSARAEPAPLEEDIASNIGRVVDLIADALEGLGLVNTAARSMPLRQELRQILGVVPAPPDDTPPEPTPEPPPEGPPIEETLTPPEEAT